VGAKRVNIPDRVSIHERPAEADGRRFGDLEMDTIVGPNNQHAIVTVIERNTNRLFMEKLKYGKDAEQLARTVIAMLSPFKDSILSITTDNGTEFTCHKMITEALGAQVYFADPYSSWQKGAIENANGLIRQYIPKGMPFSELDEGDIGEIADKINARPRKKLGFETPMACFEEKFKKCHSNIK
jgi:IS30 family transposase